MFANYRLLICLRLDRERRVELDEIGQNSKGCRSFRPPELHFLVFLSSFVGGVSGKRKNIGLTPSNHTRPHERHKVTKLVNGNLESNDTTFRNLFFRDRLN